MTDYLKNESGATSVEYALIASAIAAVVVTVVVAIGGKVFGLFNQVQIPD